MAGVDHRPAIAGPSRSGVWRLPVTVLALVALVGTPACGEAQTRTDPPGTDATSFRSTPPVSPDPASTASPAHEAGTANGLIGTDYCPFSAEQVSQSIGIDVAADDTVRPCLFYTQPDQYLIQVLEERTSATLAETRAQYESSGSSTTEDVPEVGRDAFVLLVPDHATLFFRRDPDTLTYVTVAIAGSDTKNRDVAVKLARQFRTRA